MSLALARQTLVTAVEAARAAYTTVYGSSIVIDYDNRDTIDPAKQVGPWLSAGIQVLDSYQGDLADQPLHRHVGIVLLEVHVKEGLGTAGSLTILDHFARHLQRRQFGVVRTHLADARPSGRSNGWYICRSAVPFWFDVVASTV